ncbi:MAG: hypothetical protein LBO09_09200 [Candidatus Peribacteria bacterium]|jgi:hypothetical protein|nr:hypothetical protein [Candidatus Peribacteria bacterium]
MGTLIGLIIAGISAIGCLYLLLQCRRFKKNGVTLSHGGDKSITNLIIFFSGAFLYGVLVWIFSICTGLPLWGNLLISLGVAWVIWWVIALIGVGLFSLGEYLLKLLSEIQKANKEIQEKKRNKSEKSTN